MPAPASYFFLKNPCFNIIILRHSIFSGCLSESNIVKSLMMHISDHGNCSILQIVRYYNLPYNNSSPHNNYYLKTTVLQIGLLLNLNNTFLSDWCVSNFLLCWTISLLLNSITRRLNIDSGKLIFIYIFFNILHVDRFK